MIAWSPGMTLEDMEEKIIRKAYNFYDKDLNRTSKSLKVSVEKLEETLKLLAKKEKEVCHTIENEKEKYQEYLKRARGEIPAQPVYREIPKHEIQYPSISKEFNRKKLLDV